MVPGLAVWRGRGARTLAAPARVREYAAAAARAGAGEWVAEPRWHGFTSTTMRYELRG